MNKPLPNSRKCQEEAVSSPVETPDIAGPALAPFGREDVPAVSSFGPWNWLAALALVVAVFLVYQPAWQGDFLWDDDTHLLNNPVLKPGGLAKVWTPGGYINYWPLTFTVYWLEAALWGLDPVGFHLVNVALHAISALLVWRVLTRLQVPGAMFAAAIFALHPVNVESVAWIAQLKGILSLLLALVSVLFFLAHEKQGGWWRFALAIGAFLLSTLAKGMATTLPLVLLACAWWQRGRIVWRDVLRVLPYFLIGAAMACIAVWTQQRGGADAAVRCDSFMSRTAIAGCAVWFYLWKLIWPLDLCFAYPRWQIDDRALLPYLPGVLLAMICAVAWWRRRTWGRPVVMLIVCYVGLLFPALGFVNIYFMRYSLVADHYQYAAMIVPCAVLAGVALLLRRAGGWGKTMEHIGCLLLLAALAVLSWRECRKYSDVETLYRTTLERNPDCYLAHLNFGFILAGRGEFDQAIAHYGRTLELRPDHVEARNDLGLALAACGKFDEAVAQYRTALEMKPDFVEAHINLGVVLADHGQVDEAITHFQKALEIKSDSAEAHYSLGTVLIGRGQVDDAIAQYRIALEIRPAYANAHNNLGVALAGRRNFDEAIVHFQQALQLQPDYAEAHKNLGVALALCGKPGEAIEHFQKALNLATARNNSKLAEVIRAQIRLLPPVAPAGNRP